LQRTFDDLSDYNVAKGDYIISKASGIELGFTNKETVFDEDEGTVFEQGSHILPHVNIYPKALSIELPFEMSFSNERRQVLQKAGQPTRTKQGEASFLGSAYLVDNYKIGDIIVSFDPALACMPLIKINISLIRELTSFSIHRDPEINGH
jgi:hypothetical protein